MGEEMEGKSKKAECFVTVALLTMFVGRYVTIEATQKINGQVKQDKTLLQTHKEAFQENWESSTASP